jgi:transposase-like protein
LITTPRGMRYGPGSSRKRPHDGGGPSRESVRALAKRFGVSPTTVQKWRKRSTAVDAPMGPKEPHSTVLTREEEAMVVAFRRRRVRSGFWKDATTIPARRLMAPRQSAGKLDFFPAGKRVRTGAWLDQGPVSDQSPATSPAPRDRKSVPTQTGWLHRWH